MRRKEPPRLSSVGKIRSHKEGEEIYLPLLINTANANNYDYDYTTTTTTATATATTTTTTTTQALDFTIQKTSLRCPIRNLMLTSFHLVAGTDDGRVAWLDLEPHSSSLSDKAFAMVASKQISKHSE